MRNGYELFHAISGAVLVTAFMVLLAISTDHIGPVALGILAGLWYFTKPETL